MKYMFFVKINWKNLTYKNISSLPYLKNLILVNHINIEI